ncbi:MAG: uracil-DNA glycosylase family protein [Flavobacteriaceae bacterium]
MKELRKEIVACTYCVPHLALGPNPVLSATKESKIIIIGQAPGMVVHKSGIPWEDKSGDTLRAWMGIDRERFYDPLQVALIPMGFCYPGKGKSGDLPPRKECAPQWHPLLLAELKQVKLILLVGKYAQDYYLQEETKSTLTERVENFSNYLPQYFVLPHPSPRNNIWQAKNTWFKTHVLPHLKTSIAKALA